MIVVHCTATPEGREVSVAEIDRWHRDRGWKGIGYHKVIHLDGSISNGRSIAEQGAHAAGHNAHSIGVVYVGGVTAHDINIAKDTRTEEQKRSLEKLLRELSEKYPIKKIIGHRDVAAKACPSFDATGEYKWIVEPPVSKPKEKVMKTEPKGSWKAVAVFIVIAAIIGVVLWQFVL